MHLKFSIQFLIKRTIANSNLLLTQNNFHFLSGHFLHYFTLNNSNPFSISRSGSCYRESTVIRYMELAQIHVLPREIPLRVVRFLPLATSSLTIDVSNEVMHTLDTLAG